MFLVFVLIALAFFAVAIVQTVRMGRRFLRGEEEMEPGGSWGSQLFGRRKGKAP